MSFKEEAFNVLSWLAIPFIATVAYIVRIDSRSKGNDQRITDLEKKIDPMADKLANIEGKLDILIENSKK